MEVQLTVYPNPFSDQANIRLPGSITGDKKQFIISDITGRDVTSLFEVGKTSNDRTYSIRAGKNVTGTFYLSVYNSKNIEISVISIIH